MASIRQEKIAGVIQKELSQILRKEARTICMGAMVSVTVVRMSPDMGVAKSYLSIFGSASKDEVFNNIVAHTKTVRHALSQITKNQLRRTPELLFFLDDSLDYADEIDKILKDN
ncbi:30S ribosome-binding factor RbfA [Flavobacteriales bacterium]|nr:30S ribosome-binding factor RbfA [Flavobacteriales bacterium]